MFAIFTPFMKIHRLSVKERIVYSSRFVRVILANVYQNVISFEMSANSATKYIVSYISTKCCKMKFCAGTASNGPNVDPPYNQKNKTWEMGNLGKRVTPGNARHRTGRAHTRTDASYQMAALVMPRILTDSHIFQEMLLNSLYRKCCYEIF